MMDGLTSEVPSDADAHGVYVPHYPEGQVPRSMVGLLTAVGVAMSVVASLAHGDLFWAAVVDAAAAAGLAAYLALPPTKKAHAVWCLQDLTLRNLHCSCRPWSTVPP